MATKRIAKNLTVSATTQLTKNMLRITLQGEDLTGFPDDSAGSYFKLVFAGANADQPVMRTYTVANYRKDKKEMDVDFMLHGGNSNHADGVAAPWAMQATPGDAVKLFGPGGATMINPQADWYLLAADMTALPALTANLPLLPPDSKGYVVIEILDEQDKQDLPLPEQMQVIWVINPDAGSDASPLFHAITQLEWLNGQAAVWTACEFKTMKKIRQFYREQKSIPKSHLYISSYWKQGLKEEEHKAAKREDAQA